MKQYTSIIETPIGNIEVIYNNNVVIHIRFLPEYEVSKPTSPIKDHPLSMKIAKQFKEYFSKQRKEIDLPHLELHNSFSERCLELVKNVQFGETLSYKEVATMLGNQNAARAVGNALNKNPIPMLIPCHRVIASNSNLTGFKYGT